MSGKRATNEIVVIGLLQLLISCNPITASQTNTLTFTPSISPSLTARPTNTVSPTSTPIPVISSKTAAQLSQTGQLGTGMLAQAQWLPGTTNLVFSSSNGIYIYDSRTFAQLKHIALNLTITAMAVSQDGLWIASGSPDNVVRIWREMDGKLLQELKGHSGTITRLAFSNDGSMLASGGGCKSFTSSGETFYESIVRWWRVSDGTLLGASNADFLGGLAFSPDGKSIAFGTLDNTVHILNVTDGTQIGSLGKPKTTGARTNYWAYLASSKLFNIVFNHEGSMLYIQSLDNISFWDVPNEKLIRSVGESKLGSGMGMSLSPDEEMLAVVYPDGIRLFKVYNGTLFRFIEDPGTGKNIYTDMTALKMREAGKYSIEFSPDGTSLASASGDNTVNLWEVANATLLHTFDDFTYPVLSLALSLDGKIVNAGYLDGTIRRWNSSDETIITKMDIPASSVGDMAFSSDGSLLAFVDLSNSASIQILKTQDGTLLPPLSGKEQKATSLAFSFDGSMVASSDGQNIVRLWKIADGSVIREYTGFINPIALSRDGKIIALNEPWVRQGGSSWKIYSVHLLNISDDKQISLMKLPDRSAGWVSIMTFSPNTEELAIGDINGNVRIWRVANGTVVSILAAKRTGFEDLFVHPSSISFSPDGEILAVGYSNGIIQLWQVSTGKSLCTLKSHTDNVNNLVFSTDGMFLSSGSADVTIRIWRIAS